MNKLQVIKHNDITVVDSREVARMVEKEHSKLMRDIRQYCEYLGQAKVGQSDFFIESAYKNSQNKEQPCYLITRKGCDMIANKMIGKKGVLFIAEYVTAFEAMEKALRSAKLPKGEDFRVKRAEAMARNAKVREASLWLKIADN